MMIWGSSAQHAVLSWFVDETSSAAEAHCGGRSRNRYMAEDR